MHFFNSWICLKNNLVLEHSIVINICPFFIRSFTFHPIISDSFLMCSRDIIVYIRTFDHDKIHSRWLHEFDWMTHYRILFCSLHCGSLLELFIMHKINVVACLIDRVDHLFDSYIVNPFLIRLFSLFCLISLD